MFKTLFSKQIAVLISVIVVAFAIAASVFYVFIGEAISKEKMEELEYVADQLDFIMNYYMTGSQSTVAATRLEYAIEQAAELSDAIVMLIYTDGRLIMPASSASLRAVLTDALGQFVYTDGVFTIRDERQYARVFALAPGEALSDTGDFYGLYGNTGYPWLNIQKKYQIEMAAGQPFTYAISFHAPMPSVQQARSDMLRRVLEAALIATLISVVVGFFFSRRLTRPLRKINEAARTIANGDFSERIKISSRDEIGQLAANFNYMARELEGIETNRRDFIANVSHELRTPITSIKGFVEGIIDGTIPADSQSRYLMIVKDEADRLNRLVNNLLDIARLESGEYRLVISRFDVVEMARRCVISFARQIEARGIAIEARFDTDQMFAEGDVDGIERVVYNLLHNAIKFSYQGGEIRISVREERDHLVVSVSDDGTGIPEDELAKIWERFYKSDKSRGQDKTGTGLGLSIIRSIIHEHKQKINVYSRLGEGTTFEFTLKKAERQGDAETAPTMIS